MSNRRRAETGRRGKGRWSAKREMAVVLELLRGEDLESLLRKYAATAATLFSWRDALLASGESGLKIREQDLVGGQGRQMKSAIAELAMTVELQALRIQQPENANPSLKWRSGACSQIQSPSTGRKYGWARVLAIWSLARSIFSARQKRTRHPALLPRGPRLQATRAAADAKERTSGAAAPAREGGREVSRRRYIQIGPRQQPGPPHQQPRKQSHLLLPYNEGAMALPSQARPSLFGCD